MKIGADIGGTKTLLEARAGAFTLLRLRYENDAFPDFDTLLAHFLSELRTHHRAPVTATCLARAGPITGERAQLNNRPDWQFDAEALTVRHGLGEIQLVNDFVAVAAGLAQLETEDLRVLQTGHRQRRAPALALGPGTGLGVAAVEGGRVMASEGGHIGFSPFDAESQALWQFLGAPAVRVTAERVLCGQGLADCYRYVAADAPSGVTPAEVVTRASAGEPQAARAVQLFARCFGAVAGDLALVFLARGGVYLAGGITPRLPADLFDAPFIETFNAKAEHAALMAGMPVWAVTVDDIGLRGALALVA